MIPQDASLIYVAATLAGQGVAWFDRLSFEIDGVPVEKVYRETFPPLSAAQAKWLRENVIPLKTVEPDSGFDDLRALKTAIEGAQIVGLGEATHGSKELCRLKHRIIQFLVEECGYTIVALEAPMPGAFEVNEYILTGRGDPKQLIPIYGTAEFLDLVQWMRRVNQSGKARVQFWGFDITDPWAAVGRVNDFLAKAEPDFATESDTGCRRALESLVNVLYSEELRGISKAEALPKLLAMPAAKKDELCATAKRIVKHLEASRAKYLKKVTKDEVELAIQFARTIDQAINHLKHYEDGYRDRCLAENVDWIVKQAPAGSKLVLWAHDAHIGRSAGRLGVYLSEEYGGKFLPFAISCHRGRYGARDSVPPLTFKDYPLTDSYLGTLEFYLQQTGFSQCFLDFRRISRQSPLSRWLKQRLEMRYMGPERLDIQFRSIEVTKDFDGIFFIDKTDAPTLLTR